MSLLQARWANEGLPTDPLSVENGAIMTNASRWALMIDPQLQGIKWIMNREEQNGLVIIQQSQNKYIDKVGEWLRGLLAATGVTVVYSRGVIAAQQGDRFVSGSRGRRCCAGAQGLTGPRSPSALHPMLLPALCLFADLRASLLLLLPLPPGHLLH